MEFLQQMTDKKKKVVFDDTDVRHAKLKIRLEYDGLSQAEFFRLFITGYLDKNELIMKYINEYKKQEKKVSKRNQKFQISDLDKADDLLGKFGILDDELENIFDVIAKSNPEL